MRVGMDFSEHNGPLPWDRLSEAKLSFAILRLGWGREHLDGRFYENVNGAWDHGIPLGVYYYSYALAPEEAAREARFLSFIIHDAGLAGKLPYGIWLDMEDADGWKAARGVSSGREITALCSAFLSEIKKAGLSAGIYASFDWLSRLIDLEALGNPPLWCAQWGERCDMKGVTLWQFTDSYRLGGVIGDGDVVISESIVRYDGMSQMRYS